MVDSIRRGLRDGPTNPLTRQSYQRIPSKDGAPSDSHNLDETMSSEKASIRSEDSKGLGLGISNTNNPSYSSLDGDVSRGEHSPPPAHLSSNNTHTSKPNNNDPELPESSYLSPYFTTDRVESETPSIPPPEQSRSQGGVSCPSRRKIVQKRSSWLSITILALAFYSTAFSAIYLVVASIKPRYGRKVGGDGLAPSTASLLSALFAKTIELSFVTVFVAFLGQVLSRKALAKNTAGITIADMSMRTWIMQPGTLITHWANVKTAALSILGSIALTTTIAAMLYTTAAEALVSPKLKLGDIEYMKMHGQVTTKFSNSTYLFDNCQSPIEPEMDPIWDSTCMQISFSGPTYHSYQNYLSDWADIVKKGIPSKDRPLPKGTWFDNTTVTGSWVDVHDVTELSEKFGRVVTNVTIAMPHSNVFAAARFPKNHIRQPEDFAGQGEFHIGASVPSPAVNVICAGMTAEELTPLVYMRWPHREHEFNSTTWNMEQPDDIPRYPSWLNKTSVDDIFNFGEEHGQRHPVFPKLPIDYHTILNGTGLYTADSVYLLAKPPAPIEDPPYVLCALKGGMTPKCSTRYQAAASGGKLTAHCNDPDDQLAYSRTAPDMPSFVVDPDWKNIGNEWSKSIALNIGMVDGHGSNSRLLTEFATAVDEETGDVSMNPDLPTMSEALAVMAGPVLLTATQNSPFDHSTVFGSDTEPFVQDFDASLRISDYASGGSEAWQGVFYVILALVFLTNLICLGYMYLDFRGVQLTDFTEPQNTLALALNSPASKKLSGACGGGPEGPQLSQRWRITMDERDEHYYLISKEESLQDATRMAGGDDNYDGDGSMPKPPMSPRVEEYRQLMHARNSIAILAK